MRRVYLDNAATTPVLPEVLRAMEPYYHKTFGNPNSIHSWGREARIAVEESRRILSELLSCQPDELFFTSGATESANTVILGSIWSLNIKSIILSRIEHHCVLEPAIFAMKTFNIELHWLKVDKQGFIDMDHLEELLRKCSKPALVCLLHAHNEIATVNDPVPVAELCHKYECYLLVDAVQSIGHYNLNLTDLQADFVIASAHKFHGPKGAGLLYVRSGVKPPVLLRGGAQERNVRAGTENVAGIVGIAEALKVCYQNLESDRIHITNLKNTLKGKLQEVFPEMKINGDPSENSLYSILNVTLPEHPAGEMLLLRLDMEGIAVSAGSACTSGAHKRSHVLEELGVPPNLPTIRFSFSKLNTLEEVEYVVEVLKKLYGR